MPNHAIALPGHYFLPKRNTANLPTPEHMEAISILLNAVKLNSDDPDTQTACVITDAGYSVISTRSNQLPTGVGLLTHRVNRPGKYDFIMHAERKTIVAGARVGQSFEGCYMFLNWFPCVDCAQCIVEAGITRLFADQSALMARVDDPRYKFVQAAELLDAANVEVIWW